ncbi:MAG: carbohydrate kinase family protein [Candidatus Izimaplasma sp.]|nr:carbohydrate kinase family protein [Candidatus Izimaplasma bacterium]
MQKKLKIASELKTKDPTKFNMVIGFDGFVDEIIHVVDKRQDPKHFSRVKTIKDFSDKIARASGLSSNIEFVPINTKIGGNGPIMCNALARHNPKITYIGTLGFPEIHNVFKPLEEKATIYTIEKHGNTEAVEFNDGKLILGKMNSLVNVDYDHLTKIISEEKLTSLIGDSDLFAMVNWSMLPYMTDIWGKIITNILPKLKIKKSKPLLFIDIADPEKRENEDIIEALDLLKKFKSYFKVALGLNKKEAYDVSIILGLFTKEVINNKSLEDVNRALYKYLEIDYVIVHPVECSSVMYKNQYFEENGPYIKNPKLTTGAGDNFNAGFILGLLLNLEPDEALLTGMSTSGYYVRNAKSPDYKELIQFIEDWNSNLI